MNFIRHVARSDRNEKLTPRINIGADLESLLRRAGYAAIKRNDGIKLEDFMIAREKVRPSVTNIERYHRLRSQWGAGL